MADGAGVRCGRLGRPDEAAAAVTGDDDEWPYPAAEGSYLEKAQAYNIALCTTSIS